MKSSENSESNDDGKVVQRGDSLALGTRRGGDRRGDERGLDAGRRMSDHRRVRTAFLDRIKEMLAIGISPASIARILNDEESTTAQGEAWTESAIKQLLDVSHEGSVKAAWSPLEQGHGKQTSSIDGNNSGEG